jgi:hypothetical protein
MEETIRSIYSCWNAGDLDGVIKAFRTLGPEGFSVEYVGDAPIEGEAAVKQMWDEFAGTCTVEISELLVNGDEAAAFILNHVHCEDGTISLPSIETYHKRGRMLEVRYFHRTSA